MRVQKTPAAPDSAAGEFYIRKKTKKPTRKNVDFIFCKQWVILIRLQNGFNFEVMGSMKYPKHSILLLFN